MTAKGLLNYFESYYSGKYTGSLLDTMLSYLDGYSSAFLEACAKVIVLRHTGTFGKLPDVAIIASNLDEIYTKIQKPKELPEQPREKYPAEEYEAVFRQMREKFRAKNHTELEKKTKTINTVFVPKDMCLITAEAENNNNCKGCVFAGLNCQGVMKCVADNKLYIYKLAPKGGRT